MTCMRGKFIGALAAWIMALLFAGCATLGRDFEKPQVHIAGIRALSIKGFESTFQIDLRVVNPNDIALPVEGVVCDLAINGRHLAKGVANPRAEIPAYGSTLVPVTVYASLLDMVGVARGMVQSTQTQADAPPEKWSYTVSGQLDMNGAMWDGKLPFEAKGEIDPRELTTVRRK